MQHKHIAFAALLGNLIHECSSCACAGGGGISDGVYRLSDANARS